MEWEMGATQQAVKSWKAKEWEAMGLDALIDDQLYMHNKRQCDDWLSEKKMPFCFNHPRNPNAGSRSRKVGRLKDFEVRDVLEKELRVNGQD
jgi:hypothetical protein